MKKEILRFIRPLRMKKYLETIVNTIFFFLVPAGIIGLVMSVYALIWVLPFTMIRIVAVVGVLLGIGLCIGVIQYPRTKAVIKLADSLGLKERLQTSWQLLGNQGVEAVLQREETKKYIKDINISKAYTLSLKYKRLVVFGLTILLAVILLSIHTPAMNTAKEQEKLKHELVEKKEAFEKKKEALLDKYELTDEKKEEIEKTLNPLMKKLEASKTEEEALKQLSIAKDELKKLALDEKKQTLKQLQNLTKELAKLSQLSEEEKIMEAMKQKMEQLQNIADQMDNEELKKSVSENLDEINKELENVSEEMDREKLEASLDNLNKLLEDLANSDQSDQLASDLEDLLNKLASEVSPQSSLTDLATQTQNKPSGTQTSQSGSVEGESMAQQSEGQEGSQSEGQGGSQSEGQGGSQSEGQEGSNLRGRGTTEEYLFDPTRLGGSSKPTYVKGTRGEKGEHQSTKVSDSPMEEGELVEYQQLYREYYNEAIRSADSLDVPIVMKDIILDYFSEIEE